MAQDEVILDGDLSLDIPLDGDAQLDLQLDGAVGLLTLIEAGIAQIIFNDDYTITFVLTDGREFTTGSIRGAVGEKGDKGDKGDTGERGPQGIQGERGEQGIQGIQGIKGDTGAKGDKGDKGDTGATGERGPQGPKGDNGKDGTDGFSPVATVTQTETGATVSITDKSGTTTATITNGKDGSDATVTAERIASALGYTPANPSDIPTGVLKGNAGGVYYGTCDTGAKVTAKIADCDDFTADDLVAGVTVWVKFSATNSGAVASLTLNVNDTGAKPIKYINNGALGNLTSAGYLRAGVTYPFTYDGTNWVVFLNYNSSYSAMPESEMETGTVGTGRLITAARLKQAVKYHAPVTSVNGNAGDVTVDVPTKVSELENDSEYITTIGARAEATEVFEDEIIEPTFVATDAMSKALIQNAFGIDAPIIVPSDVKYMMILVNRLNPRTWFVWLNSAEVEFARLGVSLNASTNAVTMYLHGRTSMCTGIMGVDDAWTVTAL